MAWFASLASRVANRSDRFSQSGLQDNQALWSTAGAYASLLKPRILSLLLFVALAAAYVAAHGSLKPELVALLLVTGGPAAGGAGVLNHYLERDLDALMERTRRRPLVLGRVIQPKAVLALGLGLIALGVAVALPLNLSLAFFLAAGAFVYVVVYTLWLKRRSHWNVVVGGLAGSCATLSGWSVVDSWWQPQSLLIALLLFLWTPPHFWSLAMARLGDYRRAALPMLPAVAGPKVAARWILAHVLAVVAVTIVMPLSGSFGGLYIAVAVVAGVVLAASSIRLVVQPTAPAARLQFMLANLYLTTLFVGMVLDIYFQFGLRS